LRCFILTYTRLGSSSPTSTVARHTGGEPAAAVLFDSSPMICSRKAVPSITIARTATAKGYGDARADT
jgi:hypothetical protein